MSKLTKLINNPKKFFSDAKINSLITNSNYIDLFDFNNYAETKKIAICIGFNPWKRGYFQDYIPDFNVLFVRGKTPDYKVISALKSIKENYTVFIWSYQESSTVYNYLQKNSIEIHRVEDGFIRSIGLGSDKTKPLSLVIDNDSLYFNPKIESNLEKIILNKSALYTSEQLLYSRNIIKYIVKNKISKYNLLSSSTFDLETLINKQKKTILVIGQVEDDMSIKYGYNGEITNLDLLLLAKEENKDQTILYKAHPDIFNNKRKNPTAISKYMEISTLIPNEVSLSDAIELSDHIYTISSLSGFEALLREKKVTCIGMPFYAGWGLTDDRHEVPSRRLSIELSLEKLVYSTLIEYPEYILGSIEQTFDSIQARKNSMPYEFYNQHIFLNLEAKRINLQDISIELEFKHKRVALITENSDIKNFYLGLNSLTKETQVFATTHNVENKLREEGVVDPEKCQFLVKSYLKPMGTIENKAINLSKLVSSNLANITTDLFSGAWEKNLANQISSILSDDLEDKLFNDCVMFYAIQELMEDYDYVFFHYHDETTVSDYFKLINDSKHKEKVILHSYAHRKNFEILENKLQKNLKQDDTYNHKSTSQLENNIKMIFTKIWNARVYNADLYKTNLTEDTIICANLSDRNYAYYPSAEEIFKILKEHQKNLFLLPASNLNPTKFNEYKQILFEDTNAIIPTDVYPSMIKTINEANQQLGNIISSSIVPKITTILENRLSTKLPNNLYKYLLPKIARRINDISHHIAYYFDMLKTLGGTNILITSMERSANSRLAVIAAQSCNVKTIGLQPQVISISKRYRQPIVDLMLVIDPLQEENFTLLGYPKSKIKKVGSANLRKHLQLLKNANKLSLSSSGKVSILFIMQHSMPEAMNESIHAMRNLDQSKYAIYIKPHPHQEEKVILETATIIQGRNNLTLLEADDDTYLYMKNSDIIIGLFSSALYEAILFNKDVIVLKLTELHPSIDFSRFDTCAHVESIQKLNTIIDAFTNSTEDAQIIRKKRKNYIDKNSYIYSTEALIDAINIKSKNQGIK